MPDDTLILLNNGAEESIFTLEEFQRGIEVFQKQRATWSRWPASGTFDMVKFGEKTVPPKPDQHLVVKQKSTNGALFGKGCPHIQKRRWTALQITDLFLY